MKIKEQFASYNVNFIVQKKVEQHPEMGRVNGSSLNTLRVYTYRGEDKRIHHLNTTMRFGGAGFVMDNASSGGGFCKVHKDGRVDDRVLGYQRLAVKSLTVDFGVADLRIPSYGRVVDATLALHKSLPYFDLIGWDMAVTKIGEPCFIEFNVLPAVEISQLAHGPMFGEYLDEVMNRISVVKKQKTVYSVNKFRPGFNYMLPIG